MNIGNISTNIEKNTDNGVSILTEDEELYIDLAVEEKENVPHTEEEPIDSSYIEEEVFFGPITNREAVKIEKFRNRRTECFDFSKDSPQKTCDDSFHKECGNELLRKDVKGSESLFQEEVKENVQDSVPKESFENYVQEELKEKYELVQKTLTPMYEQNDLNVSAHTPKQFKEVDNMSSSPEKRLKLNLLEAEINDSKSLLLPDNYSLSLPNVGSPLKEDLRVDGQGTCELKYNNSNTFNYLSENNTCKLSENFNLSKEIESLTISDEDDIEEEAINIPYSLRKKDKNCLMLVSTPKTSNILTTDEMSKDISFTENVLQIKDDLSSCIIMKDSDIGFEETNLENPKQSLSFPGSEIQVQQSPSKRESYFTSLKMINVDDTQMFDNFLIEEDQRLVKCKISPPKRVEEAQPDNSNESCEPERSLLFKLPPKFMSKAPESNESLLFDCVSDSSASLYPSSSSSFYSNSANPNHGRFLSTESYPSDHSNSNQNTRMINLSSRNYEEASNSTPHSVFSNQPEDEIHTSPPVSPNIPEKKVSVTTSNNSSPERFNDTIEEMELLLKYGINYFNDKNESPEPNEAKSNQNISECEESIVSPINKVSISSYSSAQSFKPNFDSTHASTDNIGKVSEAQTISFEISKEENLNSPYFETKKPSPPSKPPRQPSPLSREVAPLPYTKPLCNSAIKVTPKVNKKKLTPMNSPIVKNLSKTSLLHIRTPSSYLPEKKAATPIAKSSMAKQIGCSKISAPNHHTSSGFRTPTHNRIRVTPATPPHTKCPSHALSKTAKTSRMLPPKHHQPFLTPQYRTSQKVPITVTKTPLHQKVKGLNIVSPLAKYLQDNPPPPLVATVKPRFKLSPHRAPKKIPTPTKAAEFEPKAKLNLNESTYWRNSAIKKIDDDVRMLALKVNSKSPLKESNPTAIENKISQPEESENSGPILPPSVYLQGAAVQIENKENTSKKREIMSDRPPTSIFKHKGRVQIRKEDIVEDRHEASRVSSDGGASMMEVSVYESHSVHHTNTLR